MGDSVFVFVKQRDPVVNTGLQANAGKVATRVIPVESLADFREALSDLLAHRVKIKTLIIWSHGSPGVLDFRGDQFESGSLRGFAGKGFEDLFDPDGRIIFDGCNAGKGIGRTFVQDCARTFLFKGGGRVSARSGFAVSAPSFTVEVFSFTGLDTHALINKGGSKVRLALGKELTTPVGQWKVTIPGNEVYFYWFSSNRTVEWDDGNLIFEKSGKGTWSITNNEVSIAWESGSRENWQLPLFTEEQPIIWHKKDGAVSQIVAEKIINSNRLID